MKKALPILMLLCFAACSSLAPLFAPDKKAATTQSELSQEANAYFWNQYHQAHYDSIPQIIARLNLAMQDNPADLKSTAHLGFVHIWALSERQRLAVADPAITEHISLSRRYFEEARGMAPHDPRLLGFLADLTMTEGSQFGQESEQTRGYFDGLKSIRMWPQFNKFTVGYLFSNLPQTDKRFQQGIDWQYETIDDCACQKGTRKTDYKEAVDRVRKSTDPKIARACWNSWIAPHNWEGFCMNWGDMLVKKGDAAEARRIYALARESDTYTQWPYREALEARIQDADENIAAFQAPLDEQHLRDQKVIMFHSQMSCSGCHQMSAQEFQQMGYRELGKEFYFQKESRK